MEERARRSRSKTPLSMMAAAAQPDRSTPIRGLEAETIAEETSAAAEQFTSPPAHRTRNALKQKSTGRDTPGGGRATPSADYLTGETLLSPIGFASEEVAQNYKNYTYEYEQRVTTSKTASLGNNGSYFDSIRNVSRNSRTISEKSNESFVESILADSEQVSREGRDHLPYRLYKLAVEYWNKYPKTDYTYSHLSRDRVELAPGQIAVPNMSRLSLNQYRQGVHVYSGGLDEEESAALLSRTEEIRKRWTSDRGESSYAYGGGGKYNRRYESADSDYDETDLSINKRASSDERWLITRVFMTIVTTITTSVTTVKNKIFTRDSSQRYPYTNRYLSQAQSKSKFTSVKEFLTRRRWWLLLLLLLLLPLIYYFLFGFPLLAFYDKEKSTEKLIGFELTDDMINKIILQLKDRFPHHASEPKIIERIVESTNFDPSIISRQQDLIDKLNMDIRILQEQLAANGDLDEKIKLLISKHSNDILINIFGMGQKGGAVTPQDLRIWLSERTVNKEDLEGITDNMLGKIILQLKEQLPEYLWEPKTAERILALAKSDTKNIDEEKFASAQNMISGLYAEIGVLKERLAANENMDERIKSFIANYNNDLLVNVFGMERTGTTVNPENVKQWLSSQTVNKEDLENKVLDMTRGIVSQLREEIKPIINDAVYEANRATVNAALNTAVNLPKGTGTGCDCEDVERIVANRISLYDADKTGKVDYALESAGGQVISTRCTEAYHPRTAVMTIFYIPFWYSYNSPRVVLQPGNSPGDCWAFQGFPGYLVIKLHTRIHVTGFTLEHTPVDLVPTGRLDSAPKNFTVKGLRDEEDREPIIFGTYEYSANSTALQYFEVSNDSASKAGLDDMPGHEIVELQIDSNHGHPHYTCVYRFRIHGTPVGDTSNGKIPER